MIKFFGGFLIPKDKYINPHIIFEQVQEPKQEPKQELKQVQVKKRFKRIKK